MGKTEKEIKILDIDVSKTKENLDKIGALYEGKKEQKIYTYDVLGVKFRFYEAIELLKSDSELLKLASRKKLEVILFEFLDLVDDGVLGEIYNELGISNFSELLDMDNELLLNKIINAKLLLSEIEKININPNKWVRLRMSNDKVELTIKHILSKNKNKFQNVQEFEISVSSLEDANEILEQIGVVKRNYQEKIRYSYSYKNAKIEIDLWPMLYPYMEIECDDENIMYEIIDALKLNDKRIVSLNTKQLYKEIGIDILKIPELKF